MPQKNIIVKSSLPQRNRVGGICNVGLLSFEIRKVIVQIAGKMKQILLNRTDDFE